MEKFEKFLSSSLVDSRPNGSREHPMFHSQHDDHQEHTILGQVLSSRAGSFLAVDWEETVVVIARRNGPNNWGTGALMLHMAQQVTI